MTSVEQIAYSFVQFYYQNLHEDPSTLSKVYTEDAQLTHSVVPETPGVNFINKTIETKSLASKSSIKSFYADSKLANSKIRVSSIDSQSIFNESILISVVGELALKDEEAIYRFTQSFILKPAKAANAYDVANDIFRLIPDEDYELNTEEDNAPVVEETTVSEPPQVLSPEKEPKDAIPAASSVSKSSAETVKTPEKTDKVADGTAKQNGETEKNAKGSAKEDKQVVDEKKKDTKLQSKKDDDKEKKNSVGSGSEKEASQSPKTAASTVKEGENDEVSTGKKQIKEDTKDTKAEHNEAPKVEKSSDEEEKRESQVDTGAETKKDVSLETTAGKETKASPASAPVKPSSWAQAISTKVPTTKPKLTKPAAAPKVQQPPTSPAPLSDVTNSQKPHQQKKGKTDLPHMVVVNNVNVLTADQITRGLEKTLQTKVARTEPKGQYALVAFETAAGVEKALAKRSVLIGSSTVQFSTKGPNHSFTEKKASRTGFGKSSKDKQHGASSSSQKKKTKQSA
ncbi:UBP3-associated protein BRE5 [Cyberlindnera fabianii]|uniref:UBP3-associated protein BRE5 n=1 Tax=Cyberlindnera fabianii TaxID=36022 RepID=A0A1V2KYM8_CYBFA|nr:UBP3-associated protein BRE5 [Cyberlindnera fabianii]